MNDKNDKKESGESGDKEKPSFFDKAWRAIKDFGRGALYALPMTAITSGAALGLSTLIASQTGVDPLGVGQNFVGRWIGSTAIFSVVGGGIKAYEGWNKPFEAESQPQQQAQQREKEPRARGRSQQYEFTAAPFTPPVERTQGQVRV